MVQLYIQIIQHISIQKQLLKKLLIDHKLSGVAGLERVEQAENAASAGIKRANDQARTDAERTADEEAKRQQEEADRTRDEHNEEVAKDEKDLQDKIDDANKNQNACGKVNENDLGHNTDFDNNHSDKDGNLDDSVKDITTDDSNDKTNEPLPDPNASEKMAPSINKSGQTIYEYDEQDLTQEEKVAAVEAMVEAMAIVKMRAKQLKYIHIISKKKSVPSWLFLMIVDK